MKALYFDCSMGAAGDMLAAALLELHPDPKRALSVLNRAFSGDVFYSPDVTQKCGVTATHLTVFVKGESEEPDSVLHGQTQEHEHKHAHTSIAQVRAQIQRLNLPEAVRADALSVYDLLAAAEARVHGAKLDNIHFHEVGTIDAMADVVAVSFLLRELAPDAVFASPIHVGSGTVSCAHGTLPVPAPATAELLQGIPTFGGEIEGELCTPTGAALLRCFVDSFGPAPAMRVTQTGCGAGVRNFPRPNILRAVLGEL